MARIGGRYETLDHAGEVFNRPLFGGEDVAEVIHHGAVGLSKQGLHATRSPAGGRR